MLYYILRVFGLAPPESSGRTGKRQASWALVFIASALTVGAMSLGAPMVEALVPVLVILWPSAILAVAGAYKLEFDRKVLRGRTGQPGYDNVGYQTPAYTGAPAMPAPPPETH